jgi:ANTAR domain-containing protein
LSAVGPLVKNNEVTRELSTATRDWDDSEVSALQAYAGIVANLLGSAAAAHLKGRLADQLKAALAHGAVIEQAKGILMEREHLDAATAFEQLRQAARSSNRKVADVARDLLTGAPFPQLSRSQRSRARRLPQEQVEQHGAHDRGD